MMYGERQRFKTDITNLKNRKEGPFDAASVWLVCKFCPTTDGTLLSGSSTCYMVVKKRVRAFGRWYDH